MMVHENRSELANAVSNNSQETTCHKKEAR